MASHHIGGNKTKHASAKRHALEMPQIFQATEVVIDADIVLSIIIVCRHIPRAVIFFYRLLEISRRGVPLYQYLTRSHDVTSSNMHTI